MKIYPLGPVQSRHAVVLAATNTNPIVLTLASALGSGNNALNASGSDVLTIGGAVGNTNANGSYAAGTYVINSPTQITLTGIAGNGSYTASSATASAPQQLIYTSTFPTIPGVSDITKIVAGRMLFAPMGSATNTGFVFLGTAGLNQGTVTGVFRVINPPSSTGIMDYYDLDMDGTNIIPMIDYWIDLQKPGAEAVLCTFWIR